mgnify:CR=1 FL=1
MANSKQKPGSNCLPVILVLVNYDIVNAITAF